MTVSNIQSASRLQALQALLASSGASAGLTTRTDTEDTSTDEVTLSPEALLMARQGGSDPFRTDLDNLGQLIASGDLAGAKKAYASMQQKMQAHEQGDSQDDPMVKAFKAIGDALESGDTAAAQKAWKAMDETAQQGGGPGGPPPPQAGSGQGSQANGDSDLQALLSMYAQQGSWWASSRGTSQG